MSYRQRCAGELGHMTLNCFAVIDKMRNDGLVNI